MGGQQKAGDFVGHVAEVFAKAVGHLIIFGVAPGMLDPMALGSIGQEGVYGMCKSSPVTEALP
jgi:hypothetical protein